jgi:hypothetical protein
MIKFLWAGLVVLTLASGGIVEPVAPPAHLTPTSPDAVLDLAPTFKDDVVLVELTEITNPGLVVFSVVVEQDWNNDSWLEIARLSAFPPDQEGRYAVRLRRLDDDRLPGQLKFRLATDIAVEHAEGVGVSIEIRRR